MSTKKMDEAVQALDEEWPKHAENQWTFQSGEFKITMTKLREKCPICDQMTNLMEGLCKECRVLKNRFEMAGFKVERPDSFD